MERGRFVGVIEILTAFVVSALFVWWCHHVDLDAIDRMGQVSGIAAVEWRFVLTALVIFAGLAIASRGPRFELVSRFACAALAGLASATVAGGLAIMLHRTKFGLGAVGGDAGILIDWAKQAKAGNGMASSVYPPLQIYLLAGMSKLSGIRCAYMLQLFQIIGVAAMGPAAYAAWRLVLKSKAALAISVISVLPMIECYRQYPLLVLVITIPVLVKFLAVLRDADTLNLGQTLRYAAIFGLGLGLLFLLYSGWYQWSGPGFVVAAALVFPWRTGWRQGAILCGVSALIFGLLAYHYVTGVVTGTGVKDDYMYFDATIEPMFVAMWKGGLPGAVTLWPPIGELGGVGLFTVMLAAGLAIAIAYGRKHVVVIGVGCVLTGTWLFRLWHAHRMWKTRLVQLWPRTTAEILYLLVVLACFGVFLALERARKRAPEDSFLRSPAGFLGLVAGLILLIGSASSPTIDKYMPKDNEGDYGHLSWVALHHPRLEANQLTIGSDAKASSSLETGLWSEGGAIDHKLWRGYSSKLGMKTDHEEWLVLDMKQSRKFSRLWWWPAMDGSPIQLTIEVWDGSEFVPATTVDDFPQRYMWPQQIDLKQTWVTDKIRVRAAKLRQLPDGDYVLRLAEIELYE